MDKILGRVAKLAKAPDFDSGYRRFESCRAYQFPRGASAGKGPALIRLEWRVRPPYPRPFPAVRELAGLVVSADHQLLTTR
jgi:hypothetical protein